MIRLTLFSTLLMSTAAFAENEMVYRLLVADATAPRLTVIDPSHGDASQTFDLAAPARLYLGPDGRHAWLTQPDAGLVQAFDTGLAKEDHGDHSVMMFGAPSLISTTLVGEKPSHFNMGGGRVAVFWDGSGIATLHDPAAVIAGDATPLATINTGAPGHGIAVPVGESVLISAAPEGEGLPDALRLVGPDGAEILSIGCTDLHGEGKAVAYIALACTDGVAVFDTAARPITARLIPYPADAPAGAIRTFLSPRDTLALIGNFGADHLVILDPSSANGDFNFIPLPAPRVAFALDDSGTVGFVLLADGRMLRFSALTGRTLSETAGVTAAYSMESGIVRPMIAVAGDRVAVSDPATGTVVLLDARTLTVVDEIEVGGIPRAVLLLATAAEHAH
jgi:hypothetical protein